MQHQAAKGARSKVMKWAWAQQELGWDTDRVCLGGEIGLGHRELVWDKSVK